MIPSIGLLLLEWHPTAWSAKTLESDIESPSELIRLIAVFKLLKDCLLIVVGVGALKLLHNSREGVLEHWVTMLGANPGGRYVDQVIGRLANIAPGELKEFCFGSFVYAGLF